VSDDLDDSDVFERSAFMPSGARSWRDVESKPLTYEDLVRGGEGLARLSGLDDGDDR
jgi:hypothetical protein